MRTGFRRPLTAPVRQGAGRLPAAGIGSCPASCRLTLWRRPRRRCASTARQHHSNRARRQLARYDPVHGLPPDHRPAGTRIATGSPSCGCQRLWELSMLVRAPVAHEPCSISSPAHNRCISTPTEGLSTADRGLRNPSFYGIRTRAPEKPHLSP